LYLYLSYRDTIYILGGDAKEMLRKLRLEG
jgi:hypothetical protein